MSTAHAQVPLSVEEFLLRPERWDGYYEELVDGEVYVSPNVKPRHNEIVYRFQEALRPLESKGFVVRGEVACRVTDSSLPNADIAVVRRERWNAIPDGDFLREAPALAIEVASPGNRQLRRKALLYLEYGAEQVWIVYAKTRTVLVMTADGDREAREGEMVEFYGVRVAVSDLFPA
jgi:Uma2 family endonuclease